MKKVVDIFSVFYTVRESNTRKMMSCFSETYNRVGNKQVIIAAISHYQFCLSAYLSIYVQRTAVFNFTITFSFV